MNQLFYGDNLSVLRESIASDSADLIYLDPPFNSQADYNVLFRNPTGEQSQAQIHAFEDTWHWNAAAEGAFDEMMRGQSADVAEMLRAMRSFLRENDMMAYLVMMAVRLIELHRVLKPTGTLYLHCDPVASHYLKALLDTIFGANRFGNEIIWRRQNAKGLASTRFSRNHDVILRYTKSDKWIWNAQYTDHNPDYLKDFYKYRDPDGRVYRLADLTNPNKNRPNLTYEFMGVTRVWRWTKERMNKAAADGLIVQTKPGSVPAFKRYLDLQEGNPVDDVWTDIQPLQAHAQERLGYPTQKPLALLERIVQASSNPGDIVLDPFCGCGTAVHEAQKLGRRWIGIDITHLAISLIKKRLEDAFPGIEYEVHGTPKDIDGARALAADDKYQFQWWAVSLVNAVPWGGKKKGADSGIDGLIYFKPDAKSTEKAIVSVKGGANINVAMIRDLGHVIDREKAKVGIFLTLAEPTGPMVTEAVKAGFYETEFGQFPKIQILTVEELFNGKRPSLPWLDSRAFKKAPREYVDTQGRLAFG